ncbi:MAG: glucodextranase DOMON-like domain-containing protein [Deinococcota bacterium]
MTPVLLLTALLSVADPQGDAIGQGNLTPPSAVVFRAPGIFDVQHIDVLDQASFGFELTMGQLSNPWRLPNGFSFPIIEVYLSTHSGGQTLLLPGSNMSLPTGQRWNYAFRITGDQFNVYRATDQDIAIDVSEDAGARLEVTGNTLRVQTNITMPESFSVFGMVGSYDPFNETGWREVTREPTPWAFSSREPTVPVIDVIADSFSMQRAALAQGVLPEIRSAVRHDGWLIVAAVGFVFMLIGSVGQLWWGGRQSSRGKRRVAIASSGRAGQLSSNPLRSARPQKHRYQQQGHQPQGQPARTTSSSRQVDIGRASRGRVSNNTTRGLARQQRLGQVPTSLAQQAQDVNNVAQSTPQPDFMPADASTFTSTTEDNQAQDMLPTAMLNPAVALGVIAPAAEEQLSTSLDSPSSDSLPLISTQSVEATSASMLDQPSAIANSDSAEITTSERQQVLTSSADQGLQEDAYDQRGVDDEGASNEDADERLEEMTPQTVLNLEDARDALQDDQSDESQDMREVVAALLGQGDEDVPIATSSQPIVEASNLDEISQEEASDVYKADTSHYETDGYDAEQFMQSFSGQHMSEDGYEDEDIRGVQVNGLVQNDVSQTELPQTEVSQTDVHHDVEPVDTVREVVSDVVERFDAEPINFENHDDTAINVANDTNISVDVEDDAHGEYASDRGNEASYGRPSDVDYDANAVQNLDADTLSELDSDHHAYWAEAESASTEQNETRIDDAPETNSLRPAELIKRERLATKDQLELTDDFFDDAWFEWPNSSDIFASSKDHPDEAQN